MKSTFISWHYIKNIAVQQICLRMSYNQKRKEIKNLILKPTKDTVIETVFITKILSLSFCSMTPLSQPLWVNNMLQNNKWKTNNTRFILGTVRFNLKSLVHHLLVIWFRQVIFPEHISSFQNVDINTIISRLSCED